MTKKSILALAFIATLSACASEAPAPTPEPTEQPASGGGRDFTKHNTTKQQ